MPSRAGKPANTPSRAPTTGSGSTRKSARATRAAVPPLDVYDKELSTLEGLRLAVDDIVAVPAGGRLSWRAVCTRLRSVNGFGGSGFMAKEVLHDAMGWPSMRRLVRDEGDWTPPGARRAAGLESFVRPGARWA